MHLLFILQTPLLVQPSDPQPSESVTLGNPQVRIVFCDATQSDTFVQMQNITAVLMFIGREGQQSWIPSEKSEFC